MACQTCTQRPDCKNSKRVVLDTSVLIAILQFLCRQYQTQSTAEPRVGSFDDLCFGFEYFLQALRCCAVDDSLHVSSMVLDNELNLGDRSSAIRRRVGFPDRIMEPNRSQRYSQLSQIVRTSLAAVHVEDELVRQLRGACGGSCNLSDEDTSLIAVAILKSRGGNRVALLSMDEDLVYWGVRLRSQRQVLCGGSQVSTLLVDPEYGLTFLTWIHDCCEIETAPFEGLAEFVELQDLARYEEMGRKKVSQKLRRFHRVWRDLYRSEARKREQRSATACA